MMEVDKQTARTLVSRFHQKQDYCINLQPEKQMVNLASMASDMVFAFFNSLTEQTADPSARTQMIEAAAHGMTHALVQALLLTAPPRFERTPAKEVN